MAVQKSTSGLLAKLGPKLQQAHEAHKNDETEVQSFAELPENVTGTARLVSAKFDTFKTGDNQGQYYFFAQAAVISPREHVGKYTKIGPEPMCDTPSSLGKRKTLDDHLKWVYDQLRLLGVNTRTLKLADLEATVAMLVAAKPVFRFETYKPRTQATGPFAGKESRVQHRWLGLAGSGEADDDSHDPGSGVEDDSGAHAANGQSAGDFDEFGDLDGLGEAAQAGDVQAQKRLQKVAEKAGCWDKVDAAPDWLAGVRIIKKASSSRALTDEDDGDQGDGQDDQGGDEAQAPEVRQSCKYKPSGAKRAEECVVASVDNTKKTVNLTSLERPGKHYKNVPWDELLDAD